MSGAPTELIHPVVMCGGTGTRLWPLSRGILPKQYHRLVGDKTLLQGTVERVVAPEFAQPTIICAEDHRFIVAEQLASVGAEGRIVLEPVGRNTAAPAVVASLKLGQTDPDALILLLPADHLIEDAAAFRSLIRSAVPAARAGSICLFGIAPTRPETGYGYIEAGDERVPTGDSPVLKVRRFVEKPDQAKAEQMMAQGRFLWNSGIFLFSAATLLREAAEYQPELLALCRRAVEGSVAETDFVRLDKKAFERLPSISIDYGILERTRHAAVIPTDLRWSDLGAWDSVHAAHEPNADGNVLLGPGVTIDTKNSFVRSDSQLVATVGLDNIIVVATEDAILVADRSRAQDVKQVIAQLGGDGFDDSQTRAKIYRPWGAYQSVTWGSRFQVKLITVKPGGRLSLQLHHHRAEHWVVVRGTARITCGDRVFTLYENQSTYIPQGDVHRLENPGKIPLEMIEVQSGSYLGEDDIIRVEDVYGRTPELREP